MLKQKTAIVIPHSLRKVLNNINLIPKKLRQKVIQSTFVALFSEINKLNNNK
jgi:hypothetical protein